MQQNISLTLLGKKPYAQDDSYPVKGLCNKWGNKRGQSWAKTPIY
jgi:hypothetical protein